MTNKIVDKEKLSFEFTHPTAENRPDGSLNRRCLQVEYYAVASLKPYARNPRKHSAHQIRQIADSIIRFGFTNAILIDVNLRVLAGHARLEAAILLGLESVPTIRLDLMTEADKRAYVLADNKLAENSEWDRELLAIELQDLVALDPEFDLTITGFEAAEMDLLIQGIDFSGSLSADDQVLELNESGAPVSLFGDLWELDHHRMLCADATQAASFACLLAGKQAQMVFVDPPYNVPIDGHVSGHGSIKHREFLMASGGMTEEEFVAFLTTAFGNLVTHSTDGSIHFICMDWRHLWELLSALRKTYSELKNVCVWNKDNGGQGSMYRSKYELIFVAKNGTASHINNVRLGRFGRNRTNVWNYPGVNSFRKDRLDDLAMHPTVKPVAMVADAILDCSSRSGIVLDCFGGVGTTLIAAEKTGRRGYLMELDPKYVDVAIERFRTLTGEKVVHAATNLTFEETQHRRAKECTELSATVAGAKEEK